MVCKRQQDPRDDVAFGLAVARHGSVENARYIYATHFVMDSDDWDGGWGWDNPATDRAFAKMIASSYLLERGIGAFPESTRPVWNTVSLPAPVALREPICALKVKQPIGFLTADGRELYREHSHAFVTNIAGSLRHYFEDLTLQLVESNVTASAGPGPAIGAICAVADDAAPGPDGGTYCFGGGRPAVAAEGLIDRNALIWVFGRAPDGEVLIYYMDWYSASPQWRYVALSSLLAISDPANAAGRNEVPAVLKRGTTAHQRIDIIVRSGFKLFHMWREGSNDGVQNGWHAQNVALVFGAYVQVRTRPTLVPDPGGGGFHVFARNENGALMQYTYTPESTVTCRNLPCLPILPCSVPTPAFWTGRNVDNEIDGAGLNDVIAHNSVAGQIAAIAASSGAIHVFQRKTDAPQGLFHYVLEGGTWRRGVWPLAVGGEPLLVPNDEPELRPEDFPFDLYVTDSSNNLYRFQHIDTGMDDYLRDNITQDAVSVGDSGVTPVLGVTGQVVATTVKFEEWIVRNVFARASTSQQLVRNVWVSRSGWVSDALPTTGWKSELIPNSTGNAAVPAVNDFERVLDVYAFDAGAFVRHRLMRDRPWHSSLDYYNWASGSKYGFEYEPEESDDPHDSAAFSSPWPAWNVNMQCPCFSTWKDEDGNTRPPLEPADRAATMLHEATHLNKYFRGTVTIWGHEEKDGEDADEWFLHFLWSIPAGGLEPQEHKHSMNQMEIEFMADLGEFPAPDLPRSVWSDAVSIAQRNMNSRIIDIPPWSPGQPRPLSLFV